MRDALAHPGWHSPTTAFARGLASRLGLRALELPWPGYEIDAALAVAPVGLRSHRTPSTPVVVVNRHCPQPTQPRGTSILCGVQDDDDPACAAIAGALADSLRLQLILVHVVPSIAQAPLAFGAASGAIVPSTGRTVDDRAAGRDIVNRVARAAGLALPDTAGIRVMRGAPGPAMTAAARREAASLVVVSASTRDRLQRVLRGSTTAYLTRRCERPVVVCPRDPAAAMRLRAALAPNGERGRPNRST